jgi:hypothetical protein
MKVTRVRMGKVVHGEVEEHRFSSSRLDDIVRKAKTLVDLTPPQDRQQKPSIEVDTPQLREALSEAAAFLLPIAQAHVASGRWPMEVSAWLIMVRDSLSKRDRETLQ